MDPIVSSFQCLFNGVPNVYRRGPCNGAVEIFLGRHGSPAIENLTRLIDHQHAGLEKTLRMFDLPVGTALQKLGFSSAGVESQPVAIITNARYLLVWVTNIFKVKVPVSMRFMRKILWLASYGEDLTTCRANLLDNTVVNIAP